VAVALMKYFDASGNKTALHQMWPTLRDIADFWVLT
jgi:hypothetical protein